MAELCIEAPRAIMTRPGVRVMLDHIRISKVQFGHELTCERLTAPIADWAALCANAESEGGVAIEVVAGERRTLSADAVVVTAAGTGYRTDDSKGEPMTVVDSVVMLLRDLVDPRAADAGGCGSNPESYR
jgi:hypothetical protein